MRLSPYRALIFLGRHIGIFVVSVFAWIVSTGYFLFLPNRVATSVRFYRALFPDRSFLFHLLLAWRQFHGFAALYGERLRIMADPGKIIQTTEGFEHIEAAARAKKGALLLMSHVGNWEIGAHLMAGKGLRLMLYMGYRQKERVDEIHKDDLAGGGIRIVSVGEGEPGAASGLAGLSFLREGGLLSMAADRTWSKDPRTVDVRFLDHVVRLPAAPHAFALVARVPIITFFILREGRGRYRFVAYPPRPVQAETRADREEAVRSSAQAYADQLAEILVHYPAQWYHFEPFLSPPLSRSKKSAGRNKKPSLP